VQEPAPSAATKDVPKTTDAPANPAAPARVIDENTDMSTLTDQEIMRLMESMGQEEVTSKVSIGLLSIPSEIQAAAIAIPAIRRTEEG
jgi:hypothetical protein